MGKTISVIGLGYIGLPTAALLASEGYQVIGVDIALAVVDTVNQGLSTLSEPGLAGLIRSSVQQGRLRAVQQPEPADIFIIAVPTPLTIEKKPDISFIQMAAQSLAPVLKAGDLVILESTSPVGTTEQLASWLAELGSDLSFPQHAGEESDVRLAYCPERVFPGRIIEELRCNDRVIGGISPRCGDEAAVFYRSFVQGECAVTKVRTAEMCKLAENSFRDVNIAFANELSMVCDDQGIDSRAVIHLANRHPRVNILQPGSGVGGHCIAVDPWFIVDTAPERAQLIKTARLVNDAKPYWVLDQIRQAIREFVENGVARTDLKIACFGITFKPNVADLRDSPSLMIAKNIVNEYPEQVCIIEPNLPVFPAHLFTDKVQKTNPETAIQEAHILVFLVNHTEFKTLQTSFKHSQKVIDVCGVWEKRYEC